MLPMTPELAFVVRACLGGDEVSSPAVDWANVLTLARRHRVEGLAWQHVTDRRLTLPTAVMDQFDQDRRALSLAYLSQVAETQRLCGLFAVKGIDALVLKGCAISHQLYLPRPELRHSIDIDLLVAADRIETAEAVLLAEGYERVTPGPRLRASAVSMARFLLHAFEYVHATGQKVELHHRLLADPYLLVDPHERLMQDCEPIAIGEGKMRGLGLIDDFLYSCCHAANHAYFRLKWIVDLHRMVERLGEKGLGEAIREAAARGCLRHALLSLLVIGRLRGRSVDLHEYEAEARQIGSLVDYAMRALAGKARDSGRLQLSGVGEDFREMLYGMRLATDARSRRFKALQHLSNHEDLSSLKLGVEWSWAYAMLGRPMALSRWIMRHLRREAS